MSKLIDHTGKTFGRLVAERLLPPVKGKPRRWLCVCSCGTRKDVGAGCLTSGSVKSCGCLQAETTRKRCLGSGVDLTGQTFGRLVAERLLPLVKGKPRRWLCICSCGTQSKVRGHALTSGLVKSCGCLHAELTSKRFLGSGVDFTGHTFGELKVRGRTLNSDRRTMWICECSCGAETTVETSSLKSRQIQSCGCQARSYGERVTEELLRSHNIPFDSQWRPGGTGIYGCNYKSYDFRVGKTLIEVDGKQHFRPIKYWGGVPAFIRIQHRDQLKNLWAAQHGYLLVRVPYHSDAKSSFDTDIQEVVARLKADQ